MDLLKKALAFIIVYFLFSVSSILTPLWIWVWLLFNPSQAGKILHAMDCQAAANIGYNGRATISKECGRQHDKTTFCRRLCRWLDWADNGHCEREGKDD